MPPSSPPAFPLHPHLWRWGSSFSLVGTFALAFGLGLTACRKAPEASAPPTNEPPAKAVSSTQPIPSPAASALLPSNALPVEVRLQSLAASFESATPETQSRVAEALQTFKAGQKREAVTKLKLIDADTDLTLTQQQSVKDLINIMREPPPP